MHGILRFLVVSGLLGISLSAGCAPPAAETKKPASPAAATATGGLSNREAWDVFYIGNTRVGYGSTTVARQTRDGQPVLLVEGLNHLAVRREGQRTDQEIRYRSIETPDGRLLEFDSETLMGGSSVRTLGRVVGEQLRMETTSQGKTTSTTLPWSNGFGGMYAMEESLLRAPMQPGQQREVSTFVAGINQVARVGLNARQWENVSILGVTQKLLRIDTAMRFPIGPPLTGAVWIDASGETIKTHSEVMNLDSYRVSKAVALDERDASFDMTADLTIRLERPAQGAHSAAAARYRVTLDNGDPSAAFVNCPGQHVKSQGGHVAEITVFGLRPDRPVPADSAAEQPADADDLQPNNFIQSDDKRVVAMAAEAAGSETDPWKVAQALENCVHRIITKKDFSQAFATAAEVAQSREGDCTEHAVLLAALARARGIPARVAIGLVWIESRRAFGYHMWTEVYVQSRWIALDATLAQGGIGGGHLKLAHTNLKGASAYSNFLPVVQVIGHLTIDPVEITPLRATADKPSK